jgi:catechol 2,3-dioxygenase-like lactoylglutathione lyase family enzyme
MIDFRDLFHVGVRVPDLDAAMDEMGESMGLVWAEAREIEAQRLWTPERGLEEIHLDFTYSAVGPQHVELLAGPPGTFWDGREQPGAHHLGLWADDVTVEADRMIAMGWTLAGAHSDPGDGDGYGMFAYVRPPSGLIVEFVDRSLGAFFTDWWAGALS